MCECAGEQGGAWWHRCVPAACTVDADCGSGRRCAAARNQECGPGAPLDGYFGIGSPSDECRDDDPCGDGSGFCTFVSAKDRWACAAQICAGSGATR